MRMRPFLITLFWLLATAGCGNVSTHSATIVLANMRFEQDHIDVPVGQPVTLELVNKDGYTHAFDLDEFDIHLHMAANEKMEVTFTPTQTGKFTFYCGSPGHEAAGMVGTITITQ